MRKTFILTLFMMFCSITFGQNAAKINETEIEYATLTKAINAAQPGQTITFLRNITETVTINKTITIDGAEFQLSGTMNVGKSKETTTITIKKVNFYNHNADYAINTTGVNTLDNNIPPAYAIIKIYSILYIRESGLWFYAD